MAGQTPSDPDRDAESLLVFPSELQVAANPTQGRRPVMIGAVAAMGCLAAFLLVWLLWPGTPTAAVPGEVTVETRPAGAEVLIDGHHRGVTPLKLSLDPGAHALTVRADGDERAVPLTIVSGGTVAQYFELRAPVPSDTPGRISVVTTPAGARVNIDGRFRGVSPLVIGGLAAGEHRVAVASGAAGAARVVSVLAGGTASAAFSLVDEAKPVGGWLTVAAPYDVRVMEGRDIIGSSGTSRIMLAAGRHDIVLVNTSLGYEARMGVYIGPGRVTALRVDPPKARLSVNARPWADVFIGNVKAGKTPIANLPVAIGTHQVVFRHPQLGERRQSVVVTARGPNQVSVDLTLGGATP